MHLVKTQTSFNPEKSRSTSKEDADPFYFEEKFRSTSKEDADLFYFEEKELFTCRLLTFKKEIITIT